MNDTMIGVDLAKRVFQAHGTSMTGHVKFREKLTQEQFRVVPRELVKKAARGTPRVAQRAATVDLRQRFGLQQSKPKTEMTMTRIGRKESATCWVL